MTGLIYSQWATGLRAADKEFHQFWAACPRKVGKVRTWYLWNELKTMGADMKGLTDLMRVEAEVLEVQEIPALKPSVFLRRILDAKKSLDAKKQGK